MRCRACEVEAGAGHELAVAALQPAYFDQNWYGRMSLFIRQGKAVLTAEYTDTGARPANFCPKARDFCSRGLERHRDKR